MIGLLKVLACMPFLLYSCYSDIKTRRVSNRVWPLMLAAGSVFVIHDLLTYGVPHLIRMVLSFVFIFVFVYILFLLNAFGGADAKVLMVISIIIPTFPIIRIYDHVLPLMSVPPINLFTFSVFGNAVILTVIVPIGLFFYNLTQLSLTGMLKKPWYMFIGYRCPVSRLKDGHIRMIEVYEQIGDSVTSRYTRGGTVIEDDTIEELDGWVQKGLIEERVWVTPGLPFMIPITAGFITAVVFGDLIFYMTLKFFLM